MIIGKFIIRSTVLEKFKSWLMAFDVKNITVNGMNKPYNHLSALSLETIEVEFLTEESKIGTIVKRMIESANRGEFGHHKIILSPFRSL